MKKSCIRFWKDYNRFECGFEREKIMNQTNSRNKAEICTPQKIHSLDPESKIPDLNDAIMQNLNNEEIAIVFFYYR